MADVRIYQPTKTAMQSGRNNTKKWVLEFDPTEARRPDALMGWTSSGDTRQQIRLIFDTRDDAVSYAKNQGLTYYVQNSNRRHVRPKSYSDNFSYQFRFK